jgi:hypothetical protein
MHAMSTWLGPSVTPTWYMPNPADVTPIGGHEGNGTIVGLMGGALVVALIGIGLAAWLYRKGPSQKVEQWVKGGLGPFYEASKAKLWFDEVYDVLLVRPFRTVARGLFEIVDRFVIDTVAVNGSAFVIGLFGRLSRWFQNGQVQRYLGGVVVGAALVFFASDCGRKPSFGYRLVGQEYQFHADPGAGLGGVKAKLRWDLDGNGRPDVDKDGKLLDTPDVKIRAGEVGSHVTLWIDDPISRKTIEITQEVR